MSTSYFPVGLVFLVECRTGCSCCSSENHIRGPWKTQEEAERAIQGFRAGPLLASQYAPRGSYRIVEAKAETLPDGRIILDGRTVVDGFSEDRIEGFEL